MVGPPEPEPEREGGGICRDIAGPGTDNQAQSSVDRAMAGVREGRDKASG
jgi:hypothetical protein